MSSLLLILALQSLLVNLTTVKAHKTVYNNSNYKVIKKDSPLIVKRCVDFTVTGNGNNHQWEKTEWNFLTKLDPWGSNYETKFKVLYSSSGIYVLFYGKDNKISTQFDKDFQDLFKGDVFEVFFHPDPAMPLYLEYEINQFNKELILLVPNFKNRAFGWLPWRYQNERQVKKAVVLGDGKMEFNAAISYWMAELFLPFTLFSPLENVPPSSGTIWNANFYRLDYDSGNMVKWAWSPVEKSFHEIEKFSKIKFE